MGMKVLVACEFSGIVRDAFIARGHDAISCDLLETERSGPHLQCDIRDVDLGQFDLMIAHPPCTYLTNAGVGHLHSTPSRNGVVAKLRGEERWTAMREAAEFFNYLQSAPVVSICVENPVPHRYARELIGSYTQLIQPWQYGQNESKATCLWLKNLPKLVPTHGLDEHEEIKQTAYYMWPSPDRWKNRSRTFQGIADQMAAQWG